jgi:hypothetical protein
MDFWTDACGAQGGFYLGNFFMISVKVPRLS